jgi:hypothetical protein
MIKQSILDLHEQQQRTSTLSLPLNDHKKLEEPSNDGIE